WLPGAFRYVVEQPAVEADESGRGRVILPQEKLKPITDVSLCALAQRHLPKLALDRVGEITELWYRAKSVQARCYIRQCVRESGGHRCACAKEVAREFSGRAPHDHEITAGQQPMFRVEPEGHWGRKRSRECCLYYPVLL